MVSYKNGFLTLFSVDCAFLGFWLNHDVFQVFLAVASAMLAYGLACWIAKKKIWMIAWFIVLAVFLCQVSITAKNSLLVEKGQKNSTGAVVGDLVYGFKKIPANLSQAGAAFSEARKGNYALFEGLNYRLTTIGLLIPLMAICIIRRPQAKLARD